MRTLKLISNFTSLFLLFVTINVFAQKGEKEVKIPFDSTTQKYTYLSIIEVSGKSASDLYKVSKEWAIQKYANDKFLIDKENDQVTYLGNFPINVVFKNYGTKAPISYNVIFSITFFFKDGKTKLEITNIKLSSNSLGMGGEQSLEAFEKMPEGMGTGKNAFRRLVMDVFAEIDMNMLKLISEIETNLKTDSKSKSDW